MNKKWIDIPDYVEELIERLETMGFEAYIAGGAVRDSLCGLKPHDYDIATSARPEEVMTLFQDKKTVPTGLKHGTVTVINGENPVEITTYRLESNYTDGRHPDHVTFTGKLFEDVKRRDFTINAMAYHRQEGLKDFFGGQADLAAKRLRTVGKAEERFREDALRMLRAVRFAAQFELTIEPETAQAIESCAKNIEWISGERIQEELNRILLSDHPEYIAKLHDYGLMQYILPEVEVCFGCSQDIPFHIGDVAEHTLLVLRGTEKDLILRLAALFHDIGKPDCKTRGEDGYEHFRGHVMRSVELTEPILRRLAYDNRTITQVLQLVRYHDTFLENVKLKRILGQLGEEQTERLCKLKIADAKGQNPKYFENRYRMVCQAREEIAEIIAAGQCITIKDLAVDGNAVMEALQLPPGKAVGEALENLLEAVLAHPEWNEKEILLKLLKSGGTTWE